MNTEFTEYQISVGCALTDEWLSVYEIKKHRLGYHDIRRAHWQKLVDEGVAEFRKDAKGVYLRRGRCWDEFFNQYGYQDTWIGCSYIDIQREIDEIFPSLAPNRPRM